MHSTPALTITPESTALAGVGAMGWAVGSQPCMGNMPALVPNPIMQMKNAIRNRAGGFFIKFRLQRAARDEGRA